MRKIKEQTYISPAVYAHILLTIKNKPRYKSFKGIQVSKYINDIMEEHFKINKLSDDAVYHLLRKAAKAEAACLQEIYGEVQPKRQRLTEYL